mmetsp:Transcript_7624/g.10853  ORF Transcript_7624/g.10853 Transcript_7624/m.10853 type:complete len:385 (+) Transcript_7624:135-1289(+)
MNGKQSFPWITVVLIVVCGIWIGWPQPNLDLSDKATFPWMLAHDFMDLRTKSETPLKGLVVVVTGATSGIGLSLTKALSRKGATVVAIGRSMGKLELLQNETMGVQPVVADLGDLSSVSDAADEIIKKYRRIDILVNNAGIYSNPLLLKSRTSKQNFDETFGVNYLSHFLLTEKMLPLLRKSKRATVVQISSSYHWASDGTDLDAVGGLPPKASLPGGTTTLFRDQRSYSNSKLAQILHSRALVRRPENQGKVRAVNICPAWVGTQIGGKEGGIVHFLLGSAAYPVDGWGLASTFSGMFGASQGDFWLNSYQFKDPLPGFLSGSKLFASTGMRDFYMLVMSRVALYTQKFSAEAIPAQSSPESYNITLQDSLYQWSRKSVDKWL